MGTSKSSRDARSDLLLVYISPDSRFGAAARVNAKNDHVTLRLTEDDVVDLSDPLIRLRFVRRAASTT
jgi:hypothetical protein